MPREDYRLDPAAVRAHPAGAHAPAYWRGLEEAVEDEAFREFLRREFPHRPPEWLDGVGRRDFLKLMAASLALAGAGGCYSAAPAPRNEKIVPYVKAPEDIIPGRPLFFATAMPLAGYGKGVLVESHEGRPTKVEGNPDHPGSLGATDVFMQASVLTLYDPDRSQVVTNAGRISTWDDFFGALDNAIQSQGLRRGEGLRVLTGTVTSPTLAGQLRALLAKFPGARWHQYEPVGRDAARAGARLAFGEDVESHYRLEGAAVILSLGADFLGSGPGCVRYARDFAEGRRVAAGRDAMNRLYVVEATPTITGSMADHRLPVRPSQVPGLARAVARALGVDAGPGTAPAFPAGVTQWIAAAARDLEAHRGAGLVLAGDGQPPVVHALAHAMNDALGNAGRTVVYTDPVEAAPVDQMASLRALVQDMEAGRVELLLILEGNPVFTAPADLRFAEAMARVGVRIHLGLHEDETSLLCHWHVPSAHYLEAWSDVRAYDGTVSIIQPLIAPLYNGKTAHELLARLLGTPEASGYDILREHWRDRWKGQRSAEDFEPFWRRALHDGVVAGTAAPPKAVSLRKGAAAAAADSGSPAGVASGLEIIFQPDPTLFDGAFANNGWLQELPKPITKLTWDNAALISPATAERLGLSHRVATTGGEHGTIFANVVELDYRGRRVRAPAWAVPGHADDCVTLHLGSGRTRAGRVGTGVGVNAYALRTADAPWGGAGLAVRRVDGQYPVACTQFHHTIQGRHLVRAGTLETYRKDPGFAQALEPEPPRDLTIYPPVAYPGYAWGMSVDVNVCTGCSACVVACQAENNSPVVGKAEVMRGREMHWLRIDRYYAGNTANPATYHQPVMCQQCENAPCELVCPVGATNHSAEGLNDMTYNRCVGTRYCSNNCPYKVRRFNFFPYADFQTPSLKLLQNPNVTVRSRGVMEKCTYCVQRITLAKIRAEEEDREVRDGEIQTACQAACPTRAIVFGNINDPKSRVARLKAEPRSYGLVTELNTRPRTTYLAKLTNPNPTIATE